MNGYGFLIDSVTLWDPEPVDYENSAFSNECFNFVGDLPTFPQNPAFGYYYPFMPIKTTSVQAEESEIVISVSSTFYPGSHENPSDIVFKSTDGVLFYLHSQILLESSKDNFRDLLYVSDGDVVEVPETSAVLNVIVHMLYGMSCAKNSPSFDILEAAVDRMPRYGITPKINITPLTPLYNLLLSYAPLVPIQLYTLAAHHNLYGLALSASPHLLSYHLPDMSEEQAIRMGSVFLKRLMTLHMHRVEGLKRIIAQPPHPHQPSIDCDFSDQKKLARAWTLVSAYLAWDAQPDLSIHTLQSTFGTLAEHLSCSQCHLSLRVRIEDVIAQWASVKRTI